MMRFSPLALAWLVACSSNDPAPTDDPVTDASDTEPSETDDEPDPTDSDTDLTDSDTDPTDSDTDETDVGDTDVVTPSDDDDGDGVPNAQDCRPQDPASYPGAPELCDGVDNDCDATTGEDGTLSFHPTTGVAESLTERLTPGTAWDTAGIFGPFFDVPSAGTIRACGGTWSGSLEGPAGVRVELLAQPGHARPILDGLGLQLRGGGRVEGVTVRSGGTLLAGGTWELDDLVVEGALLSIGANASATVTDGVFTDSSLGVEPGGQVTVTGGSATRSWNGQPFLVQLNGLGRRTASITSFTATDVTIGSDGFAVTARDLTTAGYAFFGRVFSADVDGWNHTTLPPIGFSYGGIAVLGDGSTAAVAVLRDVVTPVSSSGITLQGLTSATIEGVTVLGDTGSSNRLSATDVGTLTVSDSAFTNLLGELTTSTLSAATATFTNVSFTRETRTTVSSGPMLKVRGGTTATFTDVSFDASFVEGCLEADGAGLTVTRATFEGCARQGNGVPAGGAALHVSAPAGVTYTLRDSTIVGNGIDTSWGMVGVDRGTLRMEDVELSGNRFSSFPLAGALQVRAGAAADLVDVVFDGNLSPAFGAMFIAGDVTMTGGRVHRHAHGAGNNAAVGVSGDGTFTFTDVDFGDGPTDNEPHDIRSEASVVRTDYDGPLSTTQLCTSQGCAPAP